MNESSIDWRISKSCSLKMTLPMTPRACRLTHVRDQKLPALVRILLCFTFLINRRSIQEDDASTRTQLVHHTLHTPQTMKLIVAALILSQAVAFTFVNQPRMPTVLSAEPYVLSEGEGIINVNVSQAC
jgi:hypothetical protein